MISILISLSIAAAAAQSRGTATAPRAAATAVDIFQPSDPGNSVHRIDRLLKYHRRFFGFMNLLLLRQTARLL